MLNIDGAYREGGGQIVRTAVGLAAYTSRACKIEQIRQNRSPSGLKQQHLTAVERVAELCQARVEHHGEGSDELLFAPHGLDVTSMEIDIGTAGSITLLMQALLLPVLRIEDKVTFTVTGGTHVKWSPVYEFFRDVFGTYLEWMNVELDLELLQHGFYPRGGGRIRVTVHPSTIVPTHFMEPGSVQQTTAHSIATRDLKDASVAERQLRGVEERLMLDERHAEYVFAFSNGSSIMVQTRCEQAVFGGTVLGERGRPAGDVGREAAELLESELDQASCVGRYMQDQLIPYMGIAVKEHQTPMRIRTGPVTEHTHTNIHITEQFLPVTFHVHNQEIRCDPM